VPQDPDDELASVLLEQITEEKERRVQEKKTKKPSAFQLDLATKEMRIDALGDFEDTMIFVSHDRSFLRGLRSRVLELGGESGTDSQPLVYPGSYVDYVASSGHERPTCTTRIVGNCGRIISLGSHSSMRLARVRDVRRLSDTAYTSFPASHVPSLPSAWPSLEHRGGRNG